MTTYAPPVDRLLSIGRPDVRATSANREVTGIAAADIPELIRMATDPELLDSTEDAPHAYGPIHAWWALGRLRAADAVAPLLTLLSRIELFDDDWVQNDLPIVFGQIGEPAIEPLRQYLADVSHEHWARQAAADGLGKIGTHHPSLRHTCATAVAGELAKFAINSPSLNAGLVSVLLDLRAVEQVGVIERAYVAGRVDHDVCGSLADVRAELGVRPPRPLPDLDALDDAIDAVVRPTADQRLPDWMKRIFKS